MQLKTFRAPDLPTALDRARREMGPEARVLATNEVRGRLGLSTVEITVGVDQPLHAPAEAELRRLSTDIKKLGRRLDRRVEEPALPEPARPAPSRARPRDTDAEPAHPTVLRAAVERLVRNGLGRELADRFARLAGRSLSAGAGAGELAAAAEDAVGAIVPFAKLPLQPGVLFVTGPTGSGKTTTAAKLAARAALRDGRRVVLGQFESLRVGAMEQAEIYARHIGIPLTSIDNRADLRRAVKSVGPDGLVIVDTGGFGGFVSGDDDERLQALQRLHDSTPAARTLVLLPAGLRREEARAVLERFESVSIACCGLTLVDERGHAGDLVAALSATRVPLGLLSAGARVPDDLQEATPGALVSLLLQPAGAMPRRGEPS